MSEGGSNSVSVSDIRSKFETSSKISPLSNQSNGVGIVAQTKGKFDVHISNQE